MSAAPSASVSAPVARSNPAPRAALLVCILGATGPGCASAPPSPPAASPTTPQATPAAESPPERNAVQHAVARLRATSPRLAADLSGAEAFRRWQAVAGARLLELLGTGPVRPRPAPRLEVIGAERYPGYERRTVRYALEPGLEIEAFLYVPDGEARRPGLVLWHGHGHGAKAAFAGIPPQTEQRDLHRAGARAAAEAGFVVLVPDVRGFGSSGSWFEHQVLSGMSLLEGRTALGVLLEDAAVAVDLLSSLPGVDPERLGVGGISLGGQIALLSVIFDPRVKAAAVQGYLGALRGTYFRKVHDVCQYVPGLLAELELADVARLAAPRPVVFVMGRRDDVFPIGDVEPAYVEVRAGYRLLDAAPRVLLARHPGGHEWWAEPAHAWWRQHLGAPP